MKIKVLENCNKTVRTKELHEITTKYNRSYADAPRCFL